MFELGERSTRRDTKAIKRSREINKILFWSEKNFDDREKSKPKGSMKEKVE